MFENKTEKQARDEILKLVSEYQEMLELVETVLGLIYSYQSFLVCEIVQTYVLDQMNNKLCVLNLVA